MNLVSVNLGDESVNVGYLSNNGVLNLYHSYVGLYNLLKNVGEITGTPPISGNVKTFHLPSKSKMVVTGVVGDKNFLEFPYYSHNYLPAKVDSKYSFFLNFPDLLS